MKSNSYIYTDSRIDLFERPLSSVSGRTFPRKKIKIPPFFNSLISGAFAISASPDTFFDNYLDTSNSIHFEERLIQNLSFSQVRANAFRLMEKHNQEWNEYFQEENKFFYSFSDND